MWNLRPVPASPGTQNGISASQHSLAPGAHRVTRAGRPRRALHRALSVCALLSVLPIACSVSAPLAPAAGILRHERAMNNQRCLPSAAGCDPNASSTAAGRSRGASARTPAPTALPCERLCERIEQTYHDPRTQALLLLLAQTPTGQGGLEYLLAMGAHFGDAFITWRDLRADGNVGANTTGGVIQLDSSRHTERSLIRIYLAGILVHEAVESSFAVGEGIREMNTRHAD